MVPGSPGRWAGASTASTGRSAAPGASGIRRPCVGTTPTSRRRTTPSGPPRTGTTRTPSATRPPASPASTSRAARTRSSSTWPTPARTGPCTLRSHGSRATRGSTTRATRRSRSTRLERARRLGVLDPSWPMSAATDDWDRNPNQSWDARNMETYAAMVSCMDAGIGRVLAALEDAGELDNTLVIYLQDNGACAEGMGRRSNEARRQPDLEGRMAADRLQPKIWPPMWTRDGEWVSTGGGHGGARRQLRRLRPRLGERLEHALPRLQARRLRGRAEHAVHRALAGPLRRRARGLDRGSARPPDRSDADAAGRGRCRLSRELQGQRDPAHGGGQPPRRLGRQRPRSAHHRSRSSTTATSPCATVAGRS